MDPVLTCLHSTPSTEYETLIRLAYSRHETCTGLSPLSCIRPTRAAAGLLSNRREWDLQISTMGSWTRCVSCYWLPMHLRTIHRRKDMPHHGSRQGPLRIPSSNQSCKWGLCN